MSSTRCARRPVVRLGEGLGRGSGAVRSRVTAFSGSPWTRAGRLAEPPLSLAPALPRVSLPTPLLSTMFAEKHPPPRFSPRQPSRGRPAWSDPSLSHARGTVRAWAGLASEQIPPGPELLGVCRVQTPQLFESKVVVGRPREVSPWQRCRCPTWPDRFSVPFVTAPERAGRTMDHTPFPVGPVASGARPQWFQDETHPPVGWGLGSQRPGGPRAAA